MIDHVSNGGSERKGLAGRAYGSAYKGYLARLTWECKTGKEGIEGEQRIGLFRTKRNIRWPMETSLGMHIQFSESEITFTRESVGADPELAASLGLTERLWWSLTRKQPQAVMELAAELEEKENKIRATFSHDAHRKRPRFVKLPDGRWAIRAEEPASVAPTRQTPLMRIVGGDGPELPF